MFGAPAAPDDAAAEDLERRISVVVDGGADEVEVRSLVRAAVPIRPPLDDAVTALLA